MAIARPGPLALFVALLIVGAPLNGRAQAQTAPLTPGTTAALVFPQGEEDRNRLASAVVDANPQVRAVAARVAALLIRTDLGSVLTDRLTKEDDVLAAAEQTRALLLLQRDAGLTAARVAALRFGGDVLLVLAEWLARTSPVRFSAGFGELTKDIPEDAAATVGRIAAMAVQQAPAHLDAVTQAVLDAGVTESWRSYIDAVAESGMDYSPVLNRGLTASNATLRSLTWWFTLSSTASEAFKPAVIAALGQDASQDTAWAGVARHLLARRLGGAAPVDQSAVFRQHVVDARRDQRALAAMKELTREERLSLRTLLGETFPTEPPVPRAPEPVRPRVVTARNFTSMVPGFIQSVSAATGCKARSNNDILTGARMLYRLDGRPQEIAVDTNQVSSACAEVVRILGNLALAARDEPVVPQRAVWLLLPIDASIVACIDEPHSARPERISTKGLVAPKKTRNVNPVYPAGAQRDAVQGTVLLEATISPSGCVKNAAVIRGVDLRLDLESLRTVAQWRFTPTRIEGEPVPVIMTVTVNYKLE